MIGSTFAFQAKKRGSTPLSRSRLSLKLQTVAMYYVYILKSLKSGVLYYGYTEDLRKRVREHNTGKSKFTKGLMPWRLVWYSAFEGVRKAKDFELYIKSGSGKAFVYKRLVDVTLKKDGIEDRGVPKL